MHHKINSIIFDFGGVISHFQDKKQIKKICKILEITEEQYKSVYYKLRQNYDAGLIDAKGFWNTINDLFNKKKLLDKDINKIIKYDILSWVKVNKRSIKIIKTFKNKNYKLAILSNITSDNLEYARKNFKWLKYFDYKVFSCEEKKIKPNEDIYKIVLNKISEKPENVLFIDDSEINVKAAENLGINVIHYKSHNELISEMKERYGIYL